MAEFHGVMVCKPECGFESHLGHDEYKDHGISYFFMCFFVAFCLATQRADYSMRHDRVT